MITIWQGITIQGLYCYLDMGNDTVMYYKCSHVPNLLIRQKVISQDQKVEAAWTVDVVPIILTSTDI